MELINRAGKIVRLGDEVGQGGEATVYQVRDHPDRLAKIYTRGPRPDYPNKLTWMVEHPPANPTQSLRHPSLAWPEDLLYLRDRKLAGYEMAFIKGSVPILQVFNPRLRHAILPRFNWRYLHRVARNLAAALGALHAADYVIGDLNESNVLVTPHALVTLIDTDSFQVKAERNGKPVHHYCPVGKLEYTPPELHGGPLENILRMKEQDAFGLAVLIFQLLMEGNHPFRAQWLGSGEPPPLEARIAQGGFPYMANPPLPVNPPSSAPNLNHLHPSLAHLFRRAFIDGHRDPCLRPSPEAWERAIASAEKSLITCSAGHIYSGHLPGCPICRPRNAQPSETAAARASTPPPGREGVMPQPNQRPGGRASPGNFPFGPQQGSATAPRATASRSKPSAPGQPPARTGGAAAGVAGGSASSASPPAGQARSSTHPGNAPSRSRPSWWNPGTTANRGRMRGSSPNPSASGGGSASPWGARPGWGSTTPRPTQPPTRTYPIFSGRGFWHTVGRKGLLSLRYGGASGALAGVIPGALVALGAGALEHPAAWAVLLALGGAIGGGLRGWRPANRLGLMVTRLIGWQRFWQVIGLLTGAALGGLITLPVFFLIFPLIAGLFLGSKVGLIAGRKIWMLGRPLGWERIWAGWSAVSMTLLGAAFSGWVGGGLFGQWTGGLSSSLAGWIIGQTESQILAWLALGGLGGALGGALSGYFVDLIARLFGLKD